MVEKFTFEITSKHDITEIVDKIVEESNNVTDEDLEKVPKQFRNYFKSMLSNMIFISRHEKGKHYIDVLMPYKLGKVGKIMLDKTLGLSSRLKKIFDELGIDVKVKLL